MADGRTSRRSAQMRFGRHREGGAEVPAIALDDPLAHRAEVTPDAFPGLDFVAPASGEEHGARGEAGRPRDAVDLAFADAPAPRTPHAVGLRRAIVGHIRTAMRAAQHVGGAADDVPGARDGSADFDDGAAEGEAQARAFGRAWQLGGARRKAARFGGAVREQADALGRAAAEAKGDALRGIGHMRTRIHNWVLRARGIDESRPLEPGESQAPPFTPLDRAGPWRVRADEELLHHRTQFGGAKSNLNRVDRVWYGDPAADSSAKKEMGFFKPEPAPGTEAPAQAAGLFRRTGNDRYRLAARAVMTSALDKALGTNVISDEAFAEHLNWRTGMMEMGNVSSAVAGKPLKGGAPDPVESEKRGDPTLTEPFATDIPLRSAEAQRGLSDLQVIDWITGQVDRHGGNIFMTDSGAVKGIDNDLAFGPEVEVTGIDKNVGLPPVVHADTARAVLAMSEEDLERILDGSVPPSERLTKDGDVPAKSSFKSEMTAAKERLRLLKAHLAKDDVVVSRFDDATFDRMRATDGGRPLTYLDQHAILVEEIQRSPGGEMVATDLLQDPANLDDLRKVHHRMVLENPDADLSSWARGDAGRADAGRERGGEGRESLAGRGRSRSDAGPPGREPAGRDRSGTSPATLGGAPEGSAGGAGRPPPHGELGVDAPGGGVDGSNRSGESETRGDERRLGPGGESGKGEATAYTRFVTAFGRNPQASRAAFREQWQRIQLERRAVAVELAREQQRANEAAREAAAPGTDGEGAEGGGDAARPADLTGSANAPRKPSPKNAASAPAPAPARATPNRLVQVARQARDRARDAFRGARDRLAAMLSRRPDVAAEAKADDDLAAPRGALERGGPWNVMGDEALARDPRTLGKAVNVNRVDKVEYTAPIGDSGQTEGFFKPEPERGRSPADEARAFTATGSPDYRLAGRAVLSSVLDRALGTHVLATEVFGEHTNRATGAKELGNVSSLVPGRPMREDGDDAELAKQLGRPAKAMRFRSDFDPRAPATQRGLADLQALDYLTGQVDRHGGNVFIDERGEVHGIDNDLAFGPDDDPRRGNNQGLPPVVSEDTATAVLALDGRTLESLLTLGVPPSQRLTAREMEAAKNRLKALQDHLRSHPEIVTTDFDDASFQRLRDGESYLKNHAVLLDQFAQEPHVGRQYADVEDPDPNDFTALMHMADDPDYDRARWGSAPGSPTADRRPTIDGSARERAGTAPAALGGPRSDASDGAAARRGSTSVEANVREGTSTSDARGSTDHETATRGHYALKRRSHAGTSVRSDAKKTPARGTKDRKSTVITKHRKKG